jgi:hypothetical protein
VGFFKNLIVNKAGVLCKMLDISITFLPLQKTAGD